MTRRKYGIVGVRIEGGIFNMESECWGLVLDNAGQRMRGAVAGLSNNVFFRKLN